MENATKALEMAGSLLIGVLLLGCLLFAYTRMSELKDTEHKVEVSEQAKDFNQDYETYNRNNLYGSDLFSLANQIEDYNKKEADGKAISYWANYGTGSRLESQLLQELRTNKI